MKHKLLISLLFLGLAGTGFFIYSVAHGVTKQEPLAQPIFDGEKYLFEGGTLYRREKLVPQLTVSGTHYQMGKEYGVLLRPELKYTLEALDRLLALVAKEKRAPLWLVRWYVQWKAAAIAGKLPSRFIDEMKGVAAGSGFPYSQILQLNMIYDIYRLTGCTGVVWESPSGELYHGHTTDIAWGMDWPPTVMVKHHPRGFYSFTTITWAGFLGTQTAYNEKGLCYSENTLTARKKNPRGFSVNYLARIIMEECASIKETRPFFGKYGTINGEGLVFSDIREGAGAIFETAPLSPPKWAELHMADNVLWGINLYQYPEFVSRIQDNYSSQNGANAGRVRIMTDYLHQPPEYNLANMITLLRTSTGPEGKDYAKSAYLAGICNDSTLQMLVFDAQGKGVYLATGSYYASRRAVFFYPADFTKPPFLYEEEVKLDPAVEDAARLLNTVAISNEILYKNWKRLAQKYPDEGFIHIYAGWIALVTGRKGIWAQEITQALQLESDLPDFRVAAASVAFYRKDYQQVIDLLKDVNPADISSVRYQALRLALLGKAYRGINVPDLQESDLNLLLLQKEYPPLKSWLAVFFKRLK